MTITAAILERLALDEIKAVIFYKRDEFTTDLISCNVETAAERWFFHEEMEGWDRLIQHLEKLPGFRHDWYSAVVSPAFAASETVAFFRN